MRNNVELEERQQGRVRALREPSDDPLMRIYAYIRLALIAVKLIN